MSSYPASAAYPAASAYTQPPVVYAVQQLTPMPTSFGPDSITMTCPHCNVRIDTATSKTYKCCAHLCCCCMFFSVFCTICSCSPYCCCNPEKVEHTCPHCSARLGVYYS